MTIIKMANDMELAEHAKNFGMGAVVGSAAGIRKGKKRMLGYNPLTGVVGSAIGGGAALTGSAIKGVSKERRKNTIPEESL